MRRIALFTLLLPLAGCAGFGQFISDTHNLSPMANMPPGNSENMRRVQGMDATQEALTPEPGNIWPPPAGPMPTLMDLEKQTGQGGTPIPSYTPPAIGSGGSPPAIPNGGLGAEAPMAMPKASTLPTVRPPAVPPTSLQTQKGPAVITGGGPGYTTTTNPGGGGQSIVVPNGNGTSTIIHSDGTVETVPTPK